MPDIRFVCLSDVHFGAENSILSCLVKDDLVVDTTTASPVLDRLVAALSTLIEANEDKTRKPTLILNGDILELALASDNVALAVFELFLDRIFPADGEALFGLNDEFHAPHPNAPRHAPSPATHAPAARTRARSAARSAGCISRR